MGTKVANVVGDRSTSSSGADRKLEMLIECYICLSGQGFMMVIWAKSHKIAVCTAISIAEEAYDILRNAFVRFWVPPSDLKLMNVGA